jgi:hypothetical protein
MTDRDWEASEGMAEELERPKDASDGVGTVREVLEACGQCSVGLKESGESH